MSPTATTEHVTVSLSRVHHALLLNILSDYTCLLRDEADRLEVTQFPFTESVQLLRRWAMQATALRRHVKGQTT